RMAPSRNAKRLCHEKAAIMSRWCLALLAFAPVTTASAQTGDNATGFLNKIFTTDQSNSKYVLFVPHDYKGDKEYPLILFLHGAGERGDNPEQPVLQGIGNAIKFKGNDKKFPFFVIFPQARKNGSWKAGGAGTDADRALAI